MSVAIVTLDEERNLRRTLESVKWADEIVVVDSGSKDRTCDIAREFGAKVTVEPWKGFAAQKNSAIAKCVSEWVLSLDADEEVSAELAHEIRAAIGGAEMSAFSMPRKNFFLGRWIRHGGFYPDRNVIPISLESAHEFSGRREPCREQGAFLPLSVLFGFQ